MNNRLEFGPGVVACGGGMGELCCLPTADSKILLYSALLPVPDIGWERASAAGTVQMAMPPSARNVLTKPVQMSANKCDHTRGQIPIVMRSEKILACFWN